MLHQLRSRLHDQPDSVGAERSSRSMPVGKRLWCTHLSDTRPTGTVRSRLWYAIRREISTGRLAAATALPASTAIMSRLAAAWYSGLKLTDEKQSSTISHLDH